MPRCHQRYVAALLAPSADTGMASAVIVSDPDWTFRALGKHHRGVSGDAPAFFCLQGGGSSTSIFRILAGPKNTPALSFWWREERLGGSGEMQIGSQNHNQKPVAFLVIEPANQECFRA